jgi:hypothetical protein
MPKDHNMAADQICKKVTDSQNVYSNIYLNKKTTTRMLLQVVGYQPWAQMGSNQRPPDYELSIYNPIGLHRFVSSRNVPYCDRRESSLVNKFFSPMP